MMAWQFSHFSKPIFPSPACRYSGFRKMPEFPAHAAAVARGTTIEVDFPGGISRKLPGFFKQRSSRQE